MDHRDQIPAQDMTWPEQSELASELMWIDRSICHSYPRNPRASTSNYLGFSSMGVLRSKAKP